MDTFRTLMLSALVAAACSCSGVMPDAGVPLSLARERGAAVSDVRYALEFDIPECRDSSIAASETLSFVLDSRRDVYLDVRGFEVGTVAVNGCGCPVMTGNEHLLLPRRLLRKGANTVTITFTAGEQSLNRRDRFLYTLLVPDRARTLFPCFDQPDMKARYTLSLTVPEGWKAVTNTSEAYREGRTVHFAETEPLSTYLFSFVAGEFECVTAEGVEASGKPIHLYHRETDPARIAQCTEVLRLVRSSLDWLEEYTGMDYPFAKYDLIVVPDFQYGGMEHTGATLYNDRRIFLGEAPTTDELLGRASLVAHETAHMWFGDLVTMKWFNDVWTKEVFANFFAAKMVRPLFPEVNHTLADLKDYYAPAYAEDRTAGSNAIQRPLDNLKNAGLIYCSIIYDKSPVMMSMLERRLGEERFRAGICRYLERFAYSNATWDDLIAILGADDPGLKEWSRVWVKEKGMPVFDARIEGKTVHLCQSDPFEAGNLWPEQVQYVLAGESQTMTVTADFSGGAECSVEAPFAVEHVIPNADGLAYGRFRFGDDDAAWLYDVWDGLEDPVARMSVLMSLYENVWHRSVNAAAFVDWCCNAFGREGNDLVRGAMLSYAASAAAMVSGVAGSGVAVAARFESMLREVAADPSAVHEARLTAFRTLVSVADAASEELLDIWRGQRPFAGLVLGEKDYTSMAYQLMIRFPEQAQEIRSVQASRIANPDRREAFMYVSRACSADRAERDAFFEELLDPALRGPESRVTAALSLLNHRLRFPESLERIRPALDAIEEVQRTGDIFFPSTWSAALLGGHFSAEAAEAVRAFVADRQDMDPLLMTKVLQKGGWLME